MKWQDKWGRGKFIYSTTRNQHAQRSEKGQLLLSCAPEKGSGISFEHVQNTFYSMVNRTGSRENTRVILTRVQKHAQTTNDRWHTCWQKVQDLQKTPVRDNPSPSHPPIKKTKSNAYARSPLIRLASWMSLGMMVTLLAWIAHRLVSSNSPTR